MGGYPRAGSWKAGLAAYAVAVPLGAVAAGSALAGLAALLGRAPLLAVGAVAAFCVLAGTTVRTGVLPQSRWQIPQSWARFGRPAYAFLFGGILGLGFLTLLSSVGIYALWAFALSGSFALVWPVFLSFGAARAAPVPLVAFAARRTGGYAAPILERAGALAQRAFPLELAVLGAVAVLCLAPS